MVVTSDKYILNDIPFKTDTAIIVTSYDGHLMFLKETLKRYVQTGAYVICAYDRNGQTPPEDVMDIPDAWVFKHRTYGAEKRNGWIWNVIYGAGLIADEYTNIKYVFTVNSDCIWEKPEYMEDLIELLDEHGIMSASGNGLIHTCAVLYKQSIFKRFAEYMKHKLENNISQSYSPEVLLRDYVKQWVDKFVVPIQPIYPKGHAFEGQIDHYSAYNQDSTWKRIVGYRNLGGEHKWSCLEHLEPVEKRYFDLRNIGKFLSQHEKTTLMNYYTTNDRRWLYKYWAEGEDSYYNRIYKSLEYYGKKPLYDDSKRKELGPPSERIGMFDRFDLDFDLRGFV